MRQILLTTILSFTFTLIINEEKEMDTDKSHWEDLSNALVEAANDPTSAPAVIIKLLLKQIVEIRSEELRLLDKIREEVHAVREGPLKTGLLHIEEAISSYGPQEEKQESFHKAIDEFMKALGIENGLDDSHDFFRKAQLEYFIGTCYVSLKRNLDAQRWFCKSYQSTCVAIKETWYLIMGIRKPKKAGVASIASGTVTAIFPLPSLLYQTGKWGYTQYSNSQKRKLFKREIKPVVDFIKFLEELINAPLGMPIDFSKKEGRQILMEPADKFYQKYLVEHKLLGC
jgi:hypothetical protein